MNANIDKALIISIIRFIISLSILFIMLYLGEAINRAIPIGISSSIWGMLLLFFCLLFGIINREWVAPSANTLTRYMTLFFLPICAGVIEHGQLFNDYFSPFFLAIFASTLLSLIVVSHFAQWLFSRETLKKRKESRKN